MPVHRLIEQAGYVSATSILGILTLRIRYLTDTPLRHDMYRGTTLRLHRWSQKKLVEWRAQHSPEEELGTQLEIFNSPVPQVHTSA